MQRRRLALRLLAASAVPWGRPGWAAEQAASAPKRKPDLGDAAEGTYAGDVISDSKGSSKSGVTLTITRSGPNRVRIRSDYARLPEVDVPLTSAMGKIVQQRGDTAFVLDRAKSRLDVSFHNEVSWAGERR
jgi:hypothetical protein